MTHVVVGHCPKCGAPIYAPAVWYSVTPPPSTPSCGCNPSRVRIVSTTNTEPPHAA